MAFRQIFFIMLKRGEPADSIVDATNHALKTLKKHAGSTFGPSGYVCSPAFGADLLAND